MIDLLNIEKYKENNQIEAKKATGGLPESIWETYSAFANTSGGVILLGVEEYPDKSLHPVDLPEPEWLVMDFWDNIENPSKVSLNILNEKDVTIHNINGSHIIVIDVPEALPKQKPIYIGDNIISGTYRRDGDGDYRCNFGEILDMLNSK
ncbi:MAG: ATP-binding protein [Ruminococcus sp.]|nr:ATP-binding protein [Oscillospiraceae bacterium]MDY4413128.1 ATP-binding protein [Ruminococcus sp.]